MEVRFFNWLNKSFPQNFLVRKPFAGSLIFLVVTYLFAMVYKPFHIHPAHSFNLALTMLVYCVSGTLLEMITALILKKTRFFGRTHEWTILKEILACLMLVTSLGIALYITGFFMESPGENRWNLGTFLSSCSYGYLLGIVPFGFFTLINYRYLSAIDLERNYISPASSPQLKKKPSIRIRSLLKKEELNVVPENILFIESDSNYVLFYIAENGRILKNSIRNSITGIQEQLSAYPFLMRTHRAFIVNLNQVHSQKGNSLGYRLKFEGTDTVVPVSRQNTREFDERMKRRG